MEGPGIHGSRLSVVPLSSVERSQQKVTGSPPESQALSTSAALMGLLEKLRPQPRWKHGDPIVRAAAVYELGPEEAAALRTLARDDADARVRRAAVSRIDDPAILGEIGRSDPDEEVRAEAIRGLAGLAMEASDAAAAHAIVAQLAELGRTKEIGTAAKSAASTAVRAVAVDLLNDVKALGSVSRHAADGGTRLRALARLTDADEIAAVALKSEHTDVAVAALERVGDTDTLQAVGQRARNKVAARRARTRLRAIEEATQPPAETPSARMSADDRRRADELRRRAEAVVTIADPAEARARLSEVRLAWAEFQADVEVEPAIGDAFEAASDAAREAVAEREREREAEHERQRALAREQADRIAICEEMDRLAGAESVDRAAELKAQWDALPPMPSEYAASLTRRFQDACRLYEDRERRRVLAEAAAGRLETLAAELERLVAAEQPVEETVARWRGLRRDADMLREHREANVPAAERLERAVAALEEKEHQIQQQRAKQEQDNLRRLHQLCRQVEILAAQEQITLKAGDRALREVRTALEQRVPLPSKKDRQEITTRLEDARAKLAPRVQELRDADDWQRWANLQVQEELVREMEALKGTENPEELARKMRELQGRWKQVAAAPRAQGEALWRRFKAAQDEAYARTESFFAAQNQERAANLARKQELCVQVEALADSTDWVRTAQAIQKLQAEWKTIGPVTRGHEKAVWERFRSACDRFFTRRQEDLKKRKDEWSSNLARKEELCAKAEALAQSSDWEAAAAELKRLQAEWKAIGPVRKSKSEAIWQRFRAACDQFFDRYKHRDQADLQARVAARDQVVRDLEALAPSPDTPAPDGVYAVVQSARQRWAHGPELPRAVQEELAIRYHQAIGKVVAAWPAAFAGTDLDPDATRKRMEKLVARVEELVPAKAAAAKQLSPAELLAQQWRERLASNTMGRSAENEDVKWRAAEQEIRNAQSQWMRLGPVPPEVAGPLNERFQRAVRRFYDQRRRAS
jgi:hypothetical protein